MWVFGDTSELDSKTAVPALFLFDNLRVNAERRGQGGGSLDMKRWIGLCLLFILVCLAGYAQDELVINVEKPGTLADKIAVIDDLSLDATVKMTGELNESDFKAFQVWKGYSLTLDLSETKVTVIPDKAFENFMLKKVIFPRALERIEKNSFWGCSLLEFVDFSLCVNLKEIGSSAFFSTKQKEVDLSSCINLIEIARSAFHLSKIKSIVLPPNIEIIGPSVFQYNDFTYIELPESLKEVGEKAFFLGLTSPVNLAVLLKSKEPIKLNNNIFRDDVSLVNLIVPVGSKSLYEKAPIWSLYDIREVGFCFIKVENAGGGSVKIGEETIQSGEVSVAETMDVQVSFIPDKGYYLKQVKLGATDVTEQVKGNILIIPKIVENKELTVTFEKEVYALQVSYNEGGKVQINDKEVSSESSVSINAGEEVKVTVTPDDGYRLKQILLGKEDLTENVMDGVLTIPSITKNENLVILFEKEAIILTYSVKISYSDGGNVKVDGNLVTSGSALTVDENDDLLLMIIPNDGYHLKSVMVARKK